MSIRIFKNQPIGTVVSHKLNGIYWMKISEKTSKCIRNDNKNENKDPWKVGELYNPFPTFKYIESEWDVEGGFKMYYKRCHS